VMMTGCIRVNPFQALLDGDAGTGRHLSGVN
jgi:hypothetical protein